MNIRTFIYTITFITLFPILAHAGSAQSHAPIGVMGDHIHKKGEWMTSYRYMHMDMPDNYTGTTKQSISDVTNDFMVAPVQMTKLCIGEC